MGQSVSPNLPCQMPEPASPIEIVLATNNPHKVDELRAILGPTPGLLIVGLSDLAARGQGPFHEPDEHGSNFDQNAAIKALDYARQTGQLCLADDSGLEIDALQGRPGVISSHYATDGVETGVTREERDEANRVRVLRELEGTPAERRAARFVCVMTLAKPGQVLGSSRGTFEGRIGTPPRIPAGDHGFGYDPLFLVAPDFARTSAELLPAEKNLRSHRAHAAMQMAQQIHRLIHGAA